MSIHQETRLVLCSALAISNSLVVGVNGTVTPLNLQNLTNALAPNSGLPQINAQCFEAIGFEFIWTGTATGNLIVQGGITTNLLATLIAPTGGSQNTNSVALGGGAGSGLLTWDLRVTRINYVQVLESTIGGGAGTLTCTISLMYQT